MARRAGVGGSAGVGDDADVGLGSFQVPKISFACSLFTEPAITTSSPLFQLTGVETLWLAVSRNESSTRSTSSKLRPVVIG